MEKLGASLNWLFFKLFNPLNLPLMLACQYRCHDIYQ